MPRLLFPPRGLVEQNSPFIIGRRRSAAQVFAEVDAPLHRRALLYRLAPAGDIGEIVERLTERLGDQHPGPRGHISDRIFVDNVFSRLQPPLQDAQAAVVFVGVALVRIGMLPLSVVDVVAELAGHRAEIADLPEQPLEGLLAAAAALRHEAAGLLGEVDQDRAGFENRHGPSSAS